ncbi:class I SAM-dependent methyltransferase [Xenorhabdus sp. PB61.4]|uniref:class I SAM-dependent methyltransferase n=1 Tax=Xenorhabdus sp. PB61.4 TaxID=2788940 RepID=UPI001E2C3CC1|nr:class I SAM-dependent methyltransferase [Xenorhabdus sp. PB61.4]MCC8367978.1 class I SAM-dependent methyltransferase [Xenorhabdus sp. PB61.4]
MNKQDNLDVAFSGNIISKAVMLAEHMNLFDHFDKNGRIVESELRDHYKKKSSYVDAVITSLKDGGILTVVDGMCQLQISVEEIKKKLPIFKLWLYAYRDLLSNQEEIFDGNYNVLPYDGASVARYSAEIGGYFIDKHMENIFSQLDISGTLCDMGCGAGLRLINICRQFGFNGIGMDINANAIELANKNLRETYSGSSEIKFKQQDVTIINEINPSVEAILFTFFTHHIEPNERLEKLLNDYRNLFPNLKFIILFDTVTNEKGNSINNIFARGFDYIHRLQGLVPRTRADYMAIFERSCLHVIDEIVLEVDNSYVWLCKVN